MKRPDKFLHIISTLEVIESRWEAKSWVEFDMANMFFVIEPLVEAGPGLRSTSPAMVMSTNGA